MIFIDLVFVFVIALLLTAILGLGVRRQGFDAGLLWIFILLFLLSWAGGLWIAPIGAPIGGSYWLSFLVIAIIFTVLFAALLPPARPPRARPPVGMTPAEAEAEEAAQAVIAFNIFFWILIAGLVIIIVAGYLL